MIDKNQVKHLADLARLKLSEEETSKIQQELDGVLKFVDQLKDVETKDTQPMYQLGLIENQVRQDETKDFANIKEIITEFPEKEGDQLKVKSVFKK